MVYKKKMKVITDRACWSLRLGFDAKVSMQGCELKDSTIKRRLNSAIVSNVNKFWNREQDVPYMRIGKWKQEIVEIHDIHSSDTTAVKLQCDIEVCVEDPSNNPEKLGKSFLICMFQSLNLQHNKKIFDFDIINESNIDVLDTKKGYIQLDYSVYFPKK